ncbi:hypothetical protein Tco_1508673 [Tanacetum coccineum]
MDDRRSKKKEMEERHLNLILLMIIHGRMAHVGVALLNEIPTSTDDKPSSKTKPASKAKATKPKKPKSAAEPSSSSVTPAANNRSSDTS